MDVLVVGAGVVGLRLRPRARVARPCRHRRREDRRHRQRRVVAQQRGHPWRHVLSDRTRCARATASPGGACSTPSARATACRTRNAASSSSRRTTSSRPRSRASTSKAWRTASRGWRSSAATRLRAMEPELSAIARGAFAGDRHHRQPRLHAGAAGRPRGRRRRHRLQHHGRAADPRRTRLGGRTSAAPKRANPLDAVVNSGEPRRAGAGAGDRGLSGRARAAARAREGQLFRLPRQAGLLAPDLSGAGRGRARHARDARPCRPHALRPGRRVDRGGGLRGRPEPRRRCSTPRSGAIGRGCPTARWCRTIPASARSSRARASRRPIS